MKHTAGWVALAVLLGAVFFIGRETASTPAPGPAKVQVDTVVMEAERVDLAKPSLGEKITTTTGKPTQTRVAEAPSAAGKQAVEIYCRPAIALQTSAPGQVADSSTSTEVGKHAAPARLPDFQGRIRGSRVTLYSTLNDGRRWAADYRPRGHWTFETDGDSVLMRSDRFWVRLLRGAKDCAIAGAGGGLAGLLVDGQRGAGIGAAASCGATIAF